MIELVSAALAGTAVELAWQVLDAVADPEIPVVSIRELGILRHVFAHADGTLEVVITPTYSGCPAMGQIEDDVRAALTAAGLEARITTRLAPAWTTDWMSPSRATNCGPMASRRRTRWATTVRNRSGSLQKR